MKYSAKFSIKYLYAAGVFFLFMSAAAGLLFGSTQLSFGDIFQQDFASTVSSRIFLYVRLPRTLACLVCGGALAVSGAVIQAVLANRLASPGIIGVNSGAGLAITLCTAFGIYGGWGLSLGAFLGAFAAVMLVSLIAKKWGASRGTVILIGVAVNSFLSAVSQSVVTFIPEVGVMSNDFKVGDFSAVTYQKLLPATVIIFLAFIVLMSLGNDLDVITLGEDSARGLGMNTSIMNILFLLLAALLAGCAVSVGGLLSFVGLVVPHIVRRLAGNKSVHLLALCALYAGGFVCLCDTAARTLFAPYEIPVGIIMAFLGAPFFVFLLIRRKGGHSHD